MQLSRKFLLDLLSSVLAEGAKLPLELSKVPEAKKKMKMAVPLCPVPCLCGCLIVLGSVYSNCSRRQCARQDEGVGPAGI